MVMHNGYKFGFQVDLSSGADPIWPSKRTLSLLRIKSWSASGPARQDLIQCTHGRSRAWKKESKVRPNQVVGESGWILHVRISE